MKGFDYIFHGSNAKLLDDGLVAGTYFTKDLDIALKYGNRIYVINVADHFKVFSTNEEGYYVSSNFIPLEYFIVLEVPK